MPATSLKKKHMMQMALAMKHGHRLSGLSQATRAHLHEMAAGMTEQQLRDFADHPVKKKAH